ncbi:DUF1566 domain-containing protein [Moritella marina ATCC 15381]|uniref:DUF1566 domain-containing protein n=1 Tax=Moritella marina ATCC 15381 TaxID=1202962 RepID=A0A5J6WGU2_MORMI|nr:DUF1566 domain-containing protein [Moritella marina]QFI37289.1 DUF1566 domain-containing protein [Moritella marina ATCC 15381]
MRLNKQNVALALLVVTTLWGCAPTEEEKKQKEEENKNRPSISLQSSTSISEPINGAISFPTTVSLSKTSTVDVTAKYAITPLSAMPAGDFEMKNGLVSIPAGALTADIDITVYSDNLDENDEEFIVSLSSITNANLGNISQIITINDSDLDTTNLSFETDNAQVAEGSGLYKIKILLSAPSEKEVKIPFTIAGLASEGQDFIINTSSPITVTTGTTEVEIELDFIDDNIPEGGESVILQLESPENAELGKYSKLLLTIPGDVGLNDTGITTWYNGSSFIEAQKNSDYPGQDAEFGRDVVITEPSDGPTAFSFTKLDYAGNSLPSSATNASCVQDNRTGLVFELKQEVQKLPAFDGDPLAEYIDKALEDGNYEYYDSHASWRANNYGYYWYSSDTENNGGGSGPVGSVFANEKYPISPSCAFPYEGSGGYNPEHNSCNTSIYASTFNSLAVCGFQDWKLPTIEQLRSIHNYRATQPLVDEVNFFPKTNIGGNTGTDPNSANYISSTTSADASGAAWCMNSTTGQVRLCNKHVPNLVRMVRGGAQ